MFFQRKKKYPFIRQQSEEDCGAACLAMISKFYGYPLSISRAREYVGVGQRGTTLLGIRRGAETRGFNTRAVKVTPQVLNKLERVPLPAIIHWRGYHWVVLYGRRGKQYAIADPGVGVRYLSQEELLKSWNDGVMLLLELDAERVEPEPEEKAVGFGRFLKRVWPYRSVILEILIFSFTLGLLSLASPLLLQILTDDVLINVVKENIAPNVALLNRMIIAVVAMTFISSLLQLAQSNLVAHLAQRLELGLVMEFGQQLLHLPLSYYETRRSGEVTSRLEDIQEINQLVFQLIVGLPSQCFTGLLSLCMMLIYSWQLTLLSCAIAVIMMLAGLVLRGPLQQKVRRLLVESSENQGFLVELFKGALTLKATAAAPRFWEEVQTRSGRIANLSLGTFQIGILNSTFTGLVSGLGSVSLLWFGSFLVMKGSTTLLGGTFTIGTLLAFNSMNGNFNGFVSTIIGLIDEHARAKVAMERFTDVIDATPENTGDDGKQPVRIFGEDGVSCVDVCFHHVGRVELIREFSLDIPGGKVTALVGKSGCGKSTLVKLIAGLYPVQSGRIRLGVFNSRDISLNCLRSQVVLVPQEAHFWSRSIMENFQMAAPGVSMEQVKNVCLLTGADDFIDLLPDGYYTTLGEFACNLSGGQRQRLALARAIVNEPPILILDESTSALDAPSEEAVLNRLFEHRQGKTTIMISHKQEVMKMADWIVVLDQGELKLQGTYLELAATSGCHQALFAN